MTEQLDLLGRDLRASLSASPPTLAGARLRPLAGTPDRGTWLRERLTRYVAAIYTMRPRISEAEQLEERARLIRSGWEPTPSRVSSDVEQLEQEAALRRHRAKLAHDRAEAIFAEILAVCGEVPAPVTRGVVDTIPTTSQHGSPHRNSASFR